MKRTLDRLKTRLLSRASRLLSRRDAQQPLQLHARIERVLKRRRNVYFVQVGSNDGVTGDPIHQMVLHNPRWRGMFIEPVKYLFERLKANYPPSERFAFENVAVGTRRETKTFYYVSQQAAAADPDLPDWSDQLGSFDKAHILKHLEGKLAPYIVEEPVECLPLAELLVERGVAQVDLLHIDTEGFDYHVLSQVDFDAYQPAVILFEHKHLPPDQKSAAEELLQAHRYEMFDYGDDYLALRAA